MPEYLKLSEAYNRLRETLKKVIMISLSLTLILVNAPNQLFHYVLAPNYPTIYIKADGSIDPPTAPIERNGNLYLLTGDIFNKTICVLKDNIVIDGDGHTIRGKQPDPGPGAPYAFELRYRNNVSIMNTKTSNFLHGTYVLQCNSILLVNITAINDHSGIGVYGSSNCKLVNNTIYGIGTDIGLDLTSSHDSFVINNTVMNHFYGIAGGFQTNNTFIGNTVMYNRAGGFDIDRGINNVFINNTSSDNLTSGIYLPFSVGSIVVNNTVTHNKRNGIDLYNSSNSVIMGNSAINNNQTGIAVVYGSTNNTIIGNIFANHTIEWDYSGVLINEAHYNTFSENIITDNYHGIMICDSIGNRFYRNSIANNTKNVYFYDVWPYTISHAIWDNGYPEGGNYWSDYTGIDAYSGAGQNETGIDGIGDTPYDGFYYLVNMQPQQDNYPLMKPIDQVVHDIAVLNVTPSTTETHVGEIVNITVTVANQGEIVESLNVTAYENNTIIDKQTIPCLIVDRNATLTFTWNTTCHDYGNYTITAEATINRNETNTINNIYTFDHVALVGNANPAITAIELSKTIVSQGYTLLINATVTNQGDPACVDITAYADTDPATIGDEITIATKRVFLKDTNPVNVILAWNTTGTAKTNYTISVYAWPILNETDTADNLLTSPQQIQVTTTGDVDGDKDVDIYDVVSICSIYNAKKGEPNYHPNQDINGNNKIDIYDVVAACANYGHKD
jgi:parallel beta-helix repeat protein